MSTHWTSAGFPDGFGPWLWFAYGIPERHALVHRTPLSKLTRTNLKFHHQYTKVMGYSTLEVMLVCKLGLRNGMKSYCELGGEVTDDYVNELFGCETAHRWQRLVVIVQVIVGSEDDWEQRFGQDVRGSLLAQLLNKLGLGVCKVLQLLVESDSPHLHTDITHT